MRLTTLAATATLALAACHSSTEPEDVVQIYAARSSFQRVMLTGGLQIYDAEIPYTIVNGGSRTIGVAACANVPSVAVEFPGREGGAGICAANVSMAPTLVAPHASLSGVAHTNVPGTARLAAYVSFADGSGSTTVRSQSFDVK